MKTSSIVENEVKLAYADCYMENFTQAVKMRKLDFRACDWVTREEAYRIMNKYVKGYNFFSPEVIKKFPENAIFTIAREGSVALYVSGGDKSYTEDFQRMVGADEMKFDGTMGVWRFWWD